MCLLYPFIITPSKPLMPSGSGVTCHMKSIFFMTMPNKR